MKNTNKETSGTDKKREIILGVFVLIAIILVLFFLNKGSGLENVSNMESIILNRVDLDSAELEERLPEGFPTRFPVDLLKITDSYMTESVGRYMQSSVVFESTDTLNELREYYALFLEFEGYAMTYTHISTELATLVASRGNEEVNITISEDYTARIVSITNVKNLQK